MPVIEISPDELLRAVQQLQADELDRFVERILALRAQKFAPHLGEKETVLLERLHLGFPEPECNRYKELVGKRQNETLTSDEQAELIRLSDALEEWQARRLQTVDDLAQIRQVSLASLMSTLGIR
jgi:hypothetical protein